MENTFDGLLGALVNKGVRFTLVGGIAVSLNGFVRATRDMDILVENGEENIAKLLECLADFGEGFARELTIADFPDEEGAVRVQEEFDLDIFVRMRGHKFADLEQHVRTMDIGGDVVVPYLDAVGLLKLKGESMRDKDRIDASFLKSVATSGGAGERSPVPPHLDELRESRD